MSCEFEVHIETSTIPADRASKICNATGFKYADVVEDVFSGEGRPMFTFDAPDMGTATDAIKKAVAILQYEGVEVKRYKVEEIRIDSKRNDSLKLFAPATPVKR